MKMKEKEIFGAICLVLLCLTLAIALTINADWLYWLDIRHFQLPKAVGLSAEKIWKNYQQLMSYSDQPFVHHLATSDFPMSASGRHHFAQVKNLFLLDYFILALTLIPGSFFLQRVLREKRLFLWRPLFQIMAVLPLILGILMIGGFDSFFTSFHHLLFPGDNSWLFDPATDPIINVLPEGFFMHCFLLFFCLFEGSMLGLSYLGRRQLKKK